MSNIDAHEHEHKHGPNYGCESCGDPQSMDFLDKYLTVWILGAMAVGVGLGAVAPSVTQPIQQFHLVEIGLIAMMYLPLAKAGHSQLRAVFSNWRILGVSLVQN